MSEIHLPDTKSWGGALLLSHLGVIEATGPDTATFLHGQFSQDINGLGANEARLAAFCSAKGRMQASLIVLRPQPEQCYLLTDAGLVPNLTKRLSMFVLRAKTRLSDQSASIKVIGLAGQALLAHFPAVADVDVWACVALDQAWVIRLPDVQGAARALWLGAESASQAVLSEMPAMSPDQWLWLEVMSGLPRIEPATVDQFVPQMINFELIGGVNFRKGCYPGQEVVARSQYRGTTKRRAFIAHVAGQAATGQEIFAQEDPTQPAGLVINAAPMPGQPGVCSALIELKLAARVHTLHLGSVDGPRLQLDAVPYPVPFDEAA